MVDRLINQWKKLSPTTQVFIDETGAEIGKITVVQRGGPRMHPTRVKWEAPNSHGYESGVVAAKHAATNAIRANKILLNGWAGMPIASKRKHLFSVLDESNAKLKALGTEPLEIFQIPTKRGFAYRVGFGDKSEAPSRTMTIEDTLGYIFGYTQAAKLLLEIPKCSLCNQNKGVYRNVKAGWWMCEECSPHFAKLQDDYDSGKISLGEVAKKIKEKVKHDNSAVDPVSL